MKTKFSDTERNHTTEQVAYIAFETAAPPQDQTINFPAIANKKRQMRLSRSMQQRVQAFQLVSLSFRDQLRS